MAPAFAFAVARDKITVQWRWLVAACALVAATAQWQFGDPAFYARQLPTSLSGPSAGSVELRKSIVVDADADGVPIKLIGRREYRRAGFPPAEFLPVNAPQPLGDAVMIPYTEPGSDCLDWVAIHAGTTAIRWSLLGGRGMCSAPDIVRSFPQYGVVLYADHSSLYIKDVSTGDLLHSEVKTRVLDAVAADGVIYYLGYETTTEARARVLKAWDMRARTLLWKTPVEDGTRSPRALYANAPGMAADKLLLVSADVKTAARQQYEVDRASGVYTPLATPIDAPILASDRGFYLRPEDLNTNIHLTQYGKLAQPITKLHIADKEITLPEECRSLPVEAGGWVYCIGDRVVALKL